MAELIIDSNYYNKLDIEGFSKMMSSPSYCYKFYWLEAIVQLISANRTEATYDEIINKMIANAWFPVQEYHIHLSGIYGDGEVKDNLEKRVETMGIQDCLFRIVVAEEPEIEIKNGKQVEKMHNLFPGYVFVEMKMTDEAWYVVRNTPGVSGITGSSGKGAKPFPIPREEIEPVLKRRHIEDPERYSEYKVGDWVKILNGTFQDSEGEIVDIDTTKGEVRIQITLFGRATFVPASFSDIEKADENDTRDYSL